MFSLCFFSRARCASRCLLVLTSLEAQAQAIYVAGLRDELASVLQAASCLAHVEAKNTANSANSHCSAARIRRSTRSVLCATLTGICND